MKITVLAMAALLLVSGAVLAQMNQDQSGQMPSNATVQMGPVVSLGLPASADVFVNNRFAMRIPAPAGGMSPMQRAQIVAQRLNDAFAAGMSWDDMRIAQAGNMWLVGIGDRLIATADSRSARAFGISEPRLANRWARQTVIALGGQPQMVASQIDPAIVTAVAGAQQEMGEQEMDDSQDMMQPQTCPPGTTPQ